MAGYRQMGQQRASVLGTLALTVKKGGVQWGDRVRADGMAAGVGSRDSGASDEEGWRLVGRQGRRHDFQLRL